MLMAQKQSGWRRLQLNDLGRQVLLLLSLVGQELGGLVGGGLPGAVRTYRERGGKRQAVFCRLPHSSGYRQTLELPRFHPRISRLADREGRFT